MSKYLCNSLIFSKFAYVEAFSVQRSAFSVQRSAFSVQRSAIHKFFYWQEALLLLLEIFRRRRSAFLSLFLVFTCFYRVLRTMPLFGGMVRSALLCPIVTKFILYKNRNTPKLNGFGGLRFFYALFANNFNPYSRCFKI